MGGEPAPSRQGHRGRPGPSAGGASGSGGDALRVVRVTRDQLGVAWAAETEPRSWQVVCWDSRDVGVARLELTGRHRRATFAGLARLPQPFTIAVSGLGRDGEVLWQAGLPICFCAQFASQGEREPRTEYERAGTRSTPTQEGVSRCHRSGRRRIRHQARRGRRGSRSRRRRPRAGSSRGFSGSGLWVPKSASAL
jgi:hypothetical protein